MRKFNQVDNTDNGEKIEIRRRLLQALPAPSVLECFAGEGKIYQQCYRDLPYTGLDRKQINDARNIIAVDNRRYLRSADLEQFNLFDLDAYGSPWHQFLIIIERRTFTVGEPVAFALTEGLDFKMRMSGLPSGMLKYVGLKRGMNIPMLHNHADFIRSLFITKLLRKTGLTTQQAWIASNQRKTMRYIGLIVCK